MTEPPDGPSAAVEARQSALSEREWPQPWKGPFLEAMARLPNASAACRLVGISLSGYKKARRDDPDFAEALEEAREVGLDFLEQILHRRATVGEQRLITRHRRKVDAEGKVVEEETTETETVEIDNQLLMRLLEAYRPERWSRSVEHRHSGDPDQPIQVEVYRRPSRERMLELARIAVELDPAAVVIDGTARPVDNGDGP